MLRLALTLGLAGLSPYKPSDKEVRANYEAADALRAKLQGKTFMLTLTPHWIDATHLWFLYEGPTGAQFLGLDTDLRKKTPLFDHPRFAAALAEVTKTKVSPERLPITGLNIGPDRKTMSFVSGGARYEIAFDTYAIKQTESTVPPSEETPVAPPRGNRRPRRNNTPPANAQWTARIVKGNIVLTPKTGDKTMQISTQGSDTTPFERFEWAPDGKHLVGVRLLPGDRKTVTIIQSSPPGGGRAVVKTRGYDLPGDKLDLHEMWLFDVESKRELKVDADPVEIDFDISIHWKRDGSSFTYEKTDRGNTRFRIYEVQAKDGHVSTVVDHKAATFIDQTTKWTYYPKDSDDILWRSEKDGWGRLYYVTRDTGEARPITTGDWVVRGVDEVDEAGKRIYFHASGVHPGEDPYFNHYFRVNFDGTGLTEFTPAPGNHTVQFSPDKKFVVDTYSTVTQPPVHELRSVETGLMVAKLAEADISPLKKTNWKAPEVFVSKGRDGKTDIWGVVYRPLNFDPNKAYPIVENIYAGPQDSFVPKSFAAYNYMQSVAELGFIVVQVDGMGTRNRSKAFHDVCWKNLADAGFPDRILWITALAKKYPQFDATRVGIFGTSAGGQNSTGAVLFHPEFYKVAVSSCGCHDNRMDKYWWNEQWMGVLGKHYEEQSNITNAAKLQGNLLLMVGELDTNVPPESTYRLVDALIKAGKDFEFVVLPGLDHTAGGPYGERKRRDFFVKHLLMANPPVRNSTK